MRSEQLVPVQMRLNDNTIREIKELMSLLHCENGATAVGQAIKIATMITEALVNNEHVILERKDGSRAKLIVPGLENVKR